MIKPTSILSIFLMLCCFNLGGNLKLANGQTWCVASPSTSTAELQKNLDYACSHVDCSLIQQGGNCFYPNTYLHHASYAMNLYYQRMGRHMSDCNFANTGLISLTDPSSRSCTYETGGDVVESRSSSRNQTSETWCVAKPGTENSLLQENIDFACNHVNCSSINFGGSCYEPITLTNHATVAMNLYYYTSNRTNASCDFKSSGLIVSKNPSYGNCTLE